jgi:hypothetical protein
MTKYCLFGVFFVGLLYVSEVFALPKFSLEQKKRCDYCHFNKKGGGPLNERGTFYGRNRNFGGYEEAIAKVIPEEEKTPVVVAKKGEKKKVVSLLERTKLSADMLLAFIAGENELGPNDFFLMRAEPLVTTGVTSRLRTVFGYNFATPFLTAYGQYNWSDWYVQFGSFHIPFGLDEMDYNNVVSSLIKEQYDLTLDTRDIGVEAGYEKEWFFRLAVINGAREPRERPTLRPSFDRHLGYVVNGGYQGITFNIPFLLGVSLLYERRVPPGSVERGLPPRGSGNDTFATAIMNFYGELNWRAFTFLGEMAYGRHTPFPGDRSFGFYVMPSVRINDHWDVAARFDLFANDRLFLGDSRVRYVVSTEYHFSKYASLEPMLRLNDELGTTEEVDDNEAIVLMHVRF